ncbi:ARM repeat-containing protein [Piromyces finnis]|uniref:ARM repeat-containing protein n=1 Tax=Piromyces finnis TaxID=1754191 RepID=A0A1Y1VNN6_9FUNG|nr:ARM repeat-containing protein [Piromyces finnis]|eukprot:ORX61016.1 ARM repeat-containing protein [Piromyces finnis]
MADEEDYSSLPITERIVHKLWKVRVSACEDMSKLFKTCPKDSNEFSNYTSFFKKMVSDSNLPAQIAALGTLQSYLENAPEEIATKTRGTVVPVICEKVLASTRTDARMKGIEILLLYMEIDVPDPVIEKIIPQINHRTPKVVAANISALREAIECYGTKNCNIAPILKIIPKIFGHSDKKVREEAFALTTEIYEWIGPGINSFIEPLKPIQVKELHEKFEKCKNVGTKTQKRLLRSQQEAQEQEMDVDMADGDNIDSDDMEDDPIDLYDIQDPVNVLDKIPKGFYDTIKSTKWKERKAVLEELSNVLSPPKYEEGKYGELVSTLSKRMTDPNILCVTLAANCIEKIAKGLRNSFSSYKNMVMDPLLEKLKEKKQSVIDAISNALDAVYICCTIPDISEIVVEKMKNKNPNVKAESIKWLIRCLKTGKNIPQRDQIKILSEGLLKTLSDGNSNVRDCAAEGLGTLMKLVGEKPMQVYMEQVEKSREGKVREFYEKAEIKSVKGVKKPKAKTQTTQPVTIKGGNGASKFGKPVNSNSKPGLKKKIANSTKISGSMSIKPSVQKSSDMAIDNDVSMSIETPIMSEEEAEQQAKVLFGESTIEDLQAKVWKVRLAAMDSLLNVIKEKDPSEINAEMITKLLSVRPGWKESNFQVNTRMYNVFKHISSASSFNEPIAAISIPKITEKISDLKIKKIAGECLESYIEAIGFQTVLKYMYETLKETNNPKTIADAFLWINSNLLDFGHKGVDVTELINILKIGFNHSAPACRKNAIAVISTLRMFCGPDIRSFIEDLNPSLLSTIDAEFEKAGKRNPPTPTRVQGSSQKSIPMNQDNVVSQKPVIQKVDISEQLNEALINKLGDSNWRSRKEALDEIEELINNANKHIKPNLGELPVALVHRFNDSNKNLVVKAIDLYSLLVTAVGQPFINNSKLMINSIIPLFGDNKVQTRNAVLNALNSTMTIMPIDTLIQTISEIMTNDQPLFRKEMSKWLNDTLNDLSSNGKPLPDLNLIIHVNILYLMDKNNEVRRAAQSSFTYIANGLSVDAIKKACSHVKGSSSVVLPLLESIRPGSTVVSPPKQTTPTVKEIPGLSKARLAGSNKRRSQIAPPINSKHAAITESSSQPPILTMDNRAKEIRAEKDRGLTKWNLDSSKQDLILFLSEQCENHFSLDIRNLLFSNSHYKEKDYLNSLNMLYSCLADRQYVSQKWGISWEENCLRFISVTDLILKYLTLRFCDTNTTILIKCLDLLDALFIVLDENGYYLSEYEASCFLPSLINKIGDSKETIRQRIKTLIKQLCRIYPASRTFIYICEGLKSKNSRVRVECLNELGCLIQRNGLSVCHPNKALLIIANQISDRDPNVRNEALNTIVEAYKQVGDNVFKYISNIPERNRQLIDEKLKRLPSYSMYQNKPMINDVNQMNGNMINDSMDQNRRIQQNMMGQSPTPMDVDVPSNDNVQRAYQDNQVKKEFSLDIDKLNLPQLSNPVNYSLNNNMNDGVSPMAMENESPIMNSNVNGPIPNNGFGYGNRRSLYDYSSNGMQKDYMMDFITTQIMSGVSTESVDALKQLDPILRNHPEIVIPHINQTINAITFQMKLVFSSDNINAPGLVRLCKHLINVLVLIFSNVELSKIIEKDSLYPLFEEVLKGMLDHNLTKSEAGSQLVRALNILMVRILDNSNRNISFSALLLLLEKSSAILVSMTNESNEKIMLQAKFTELVMKCLWKMTKVIHKMLETHTLEVNQLLLDINNLFIATPPSEWKKRASENFPVGDMPLRTIKTILSELTSSLGDKIFENFDLINDPQRSYVYSYVSHMVQSQKKRNALQSQSTSNPSSASSSPVSSQPRYSQHLSMSQSNSNNSIGSTNTINSINSGNSSNMPSNKELGNCNNGDELDHRLDFLFEKMQRGDQIKPTIKEIYQIQQAYPEAKNKIDERINNSSSLIRTLVRRGLTTLSESSNESQSSIPTFSHNDLSNNRLSMTSTRFSDDTTETYKQKLLKLQQMFGYKNENGVNSGTQNVRYSSQLSGGSSTAIPHSSANSSLPLPNNNSGSSSSVTVAGLKERLERMKQSMNNPYSTSNRYSINSQPK